MSMIPVLLDPATGDIYSGGDEDSGALRPGKARRLTNRLSRLNARESKLRSMLGQETSDITDGSLPLPEMYQTATAAGMITENQFNGLGSTAITASSTGTLSDTINRTFWGKSLVLDADDPSSILVTAISVAGLPVNVGSKGAPLSMFGSTSTRFGISFGRRVALTGQTFSVSLSNIDSGSGHTASGGIIGDEVNPYAGQQAQEYMLLQGVGKLLGM